MEIVLHAAGRRRTARARAARARRRGARPSVRCSRWCCGIIIDPQLYHARPAPAARGPGARRGPHATSGCGRSARSRPPTADPRRSCLNGRALYLRGALHQSFYPDGVYTAGDARTLRDDIAFAKKAGFDFLRIHIKIDDPLLLYYADTLGMLLMADFPNFGEGGDTPLGRARFETMMRAAVERDFNHPSIIAWCMFNETWGFGGQVELMKWMEERHLVCAPPSGQGAAHTGSRGEETASRAAGQPPVPLKIHNEDAHKWVQADVARGQGRSTRRG